LLVAGRIESCEILSVSTRLPEPAVVDYYLELMPAEVRRSAQARIQLLEVDDGSSRPVAAKLLDRADLLQRIREHVAGRPALIEPWNVTEPEVALALALGVPINGTRPELRGLGFKSQGRRLMRRAGVPVPVGREDVHSIDDVIAAIGEIRAERPDVGGVVIKHDDSGAGDGNVVLDLSLAVTEADPGAWLRARLEEMPAWYRTDLERGGIVEERIAGERFSSPSAQVDIGPDGTVNVLATHEQVLGGDDGQVYLGCRFPADPAYAAELARHAAAIGAELAREGAGGRFAVDFVVVADEAGAWRIHAIEVNLRKGGTTHPYAALRNAVPGRYDAEAGMWLAASDGEPRAYGATDNLVDSAWTGLTPRAVIAAVKRFGLQFDPETGVGVVLHMLSGLAIDGRFGLTAIARTPTEAAAMQDGVKRAVDELIATRVR
jgi:hypothetical protein